MQISKQGAMPCGQPTILGWLRSCSCACYSSTIDIDLYLVVLAVPGTLHPSTTPDLLRLAVDDVAVRRRRRRRHAPENDGGGDPAVPTTTTSAETGAGATAIAVLSNGKAFFVVDS